MNRPTESAASRLVSSRPSPPGVRRRPRNSNWGRSLRPKATSGRSARRFSISPTSFPRFSGSRRKRKARKRPTTNPTTIAKTNSPLPTILVTVLEALREEVAEQDQARRPEPGPEDAEGREVPVGQPAAAGDERRQRADQADEAADQDRPAPVPREVALDLLKRSSVIRKRSPCWTTNPRPSLAPSRKLTVSPAKAQAQVTARISGSEMSALPRDGAAEDHGELARRDQADKGARSRGRRARPTSR